MNILNNFSVIQSVSLPCKYVAKYGANYCYFILKYVLKDLTYVPRPVLLPTCFKGSWSWKASSSEKHLKILCFYSTLTFEIGKRCKSVRYTILVFSLQIFSTQDGVQHGPALRHNQWTGLELVCRTDLSDEMSSFVFALPLPSDHTGLLPGQYLAVGHLEVCRSFGPTK